MDIMFIGMYVKNKKPTSILKIFLLKEYYCRMFFTPTACRVVFAVNFKSSKSWCTVDAYIEI